jgi:hypothetical protein
LTIHGPDPFHTDAASFVLGETLIGLLRRIRDDLKAAQNDQILERPVLGAVVCLRVLLEAFPQYGFHCHPLDIKEWREQYFQWLDANIGKIRLKAKDKVELREIAAKEFDRVLELSKSKGYRLENR